MAKMIDITTGVEQNVSQHHCRRNNTGKNMIEVSFGEGVYAQLKESERGQYGFMTPTGKLQKRRYDLFRIDK